MVLGEMAGDDTGCCDLESELEVSEPPENFLLVAGNSGRSRDPELFGLVCCPGG
jgi:hypothetical protein